MLINAKKGSAITLVILTGKRFRSQVRNSRIILIHAVYDQNDRLFWEKHCVTAANVIALALRDPVVAYAML